MESSFVITPHVINTINSLPMEERLAITAALAGEMILGADSRTTLTPVQEMIYSMIAFARASLTMSTRACV